MGKGRERRIVRGIGEKQGRWIGKKDCNMEGREGGIID
jgi:hypothetical protein